MEIFYILSIFYIGTVLGYPVNNNKNLTLYKAIVDGCPKIVNDTNLKTLKLFNICENVTITPQQQQQGQLAKNDLLCLLFYNTFISYCNQTQEITTPTPLPNDIYQKYNLSTICDNVAILTDLPQTTPANQSLNNLKKLIDSKEKCIDICNHTSSLIFQIEPVCSLSYYYGHLFVNKKAVKLEEDTKLQTSQSKNVGEQQNVTKQDPKIVQPQKFDNKSHEKPPPIKQNTKPIILEKNNEPTVKKQDQNIIKPTESVKKPDEPVEKKEDQKKSPKEISTTTVETKQTSIEKIDVVNTEKTKVSVDNNESLKNPEQIEVNSDFDMQQQQDQLDSEDDTDTMDEAPKLKEIIKPETVDETQSIDYTTEMGGDSYFFSYFMMLCIIFIVGYICYHNKQKILALILEGRRGKRQFRNRRPNSANYHKLDSNLEEAITSSCTKNTSNVIY